MNTLAVELRKITHVTEKYVIRTSKKYQCTHQDFLQKATVVFDEILKSGGT